MSSASRRSTSAGRWTSRGPNRDTARLQQSDRELRGWSGNVKELRLLRGWSRPLHVVYAIDHEKRIIVFITVYEPDLGHWRPDFRGAEALMDCVMCDGTTIATTRPKAVERDGRVAVIRDVPVEVCESCGDVYLDAAVAEQLHDLFRKMLRGNVDQVFGHYVTDAA